MKLNSSKFFKASSFLTLVSLCFSFLPIAHAQLVVSPPPVRNIIFPVVGTVSYGDDFGAPRSGGRTHEGNDLMGKKLMPLVAAVDGIVSFINYPEATWGYAVGIRDSEGYDYWYLHVNNDNPGTDDGKGDGFFAYAPDIQPGNKVVKGQLVGWMGDSGDAEATSPHLHFEIHDPSGTAFDPFASLKAATHIPNPMTDYPALSGEILPYGNFPGGANIASGNFDTDIALEAVTGAGPGGGPQVSIFKKNGTQNFSFYAYDPNFRGGVDVATGDVDGDGHDEIITAPGFGGGPDIRIYKPNGQLSGEFMAYDPKFYGGVRIAVADLDGDGKAEIITAPGVGGGPDVRVFSASGQKLLEFMAYDSKFHGGIDITALSKKSANGASIAQASEIITAPGHGGGPDIKVFDSNAVLQKEFMAYDSNFHGGVRVNAGSNFGAGQTPGIITMPASEGGPNIKVFGNDGLVVKDALAGFESWWRGGYDVAASDGYVFIASAGGRRTSIRTYDFTSPQIGNGRNNFSGQCRNCQFSQ